MKRPLLITDCDEVLLHMVGPFGQWLGERHEIDFAMQHADFGNALTRRADNSVVETDQIWPLLDSFFTTEMHRQTLVPHARQALATIAEFADIVVLTNLTDEFHGSRVAQLEAVDIDEEHGGEGVVVIRPLKRLIEAVQEHSPIGETGEDIDKGEALYSLVYIAGHPA